MPERSWDIETRTIGGGCLIRLKGVIDETFDTEGPTQTQGTPVVWDLDGVHRITSFGVRQWVRMLQNMDAPAYAFVRVRPALVAQFNMIEGFAGRGDLVSLYAPYLCLECDRAFEHLFDLRTDYDSVSASEDPPTPPCRHCGGVSEFDDLPEVYFSYVLGRPQPVVPAVIERVIDARSEPSAAQLSIRKDLGDDVTALWLSGPLSGRIRFERLIDDLDQNVVIVCADVTSSTAKGRASFADLSRVEGATVYLARLPAELASLLHSEEGLPASAKVASLLAEGSCSSCGRPADVEVTHETLSVDTDVLPGHCSVCGLSEVLEPRFDHEVAEALLVAEPPRLIRSYLLSRQRRTITRSETEIMPSRTQATGPGGMPRTLGRYEIVSRLARGGMGEIFVARQRGPQGFERDLILKRLLPRFAGTPQAVQMFLQEAQLAAKISDPRVVSIIDFGRAGNDYFLAMEYVRGADLRGIIAWSRNTGVPLPVNVAGRIASEICAALNAAHSCTDRDGKPLGIIHRDVSPSNVLISWEGVIKLTDFGIAKAVEMNPETDPELLKGKLRYMAPERLTPSAGPVDARSDIYSAGVILFEMLTGRHPFTQREGEEPAEPERLQQLRKDAPAELVDILLQALAARPADRYSTAREFGEALDNLFERPATAAQVAQWVKLVGKTSQEVTAEVVAPESEGSLTSVQEKGGTEFDQTDGSDPQATAASRKLRTSDKASSDPG